MTEDTSREENFLSRWSRLKQRGGEPAPVDRPEEKAPRAEDRTVDRNSDDRAQGNTDDTVPLEDLPPLESIDSTTDLSPWLKKKLPAEWKRAALRRVWAADPSIANFVGPADYAWDWNAPDGVPGFGPLRAIDDVAALVAQAVGTPLAEPKKEAQAQDAQRADEQAAKKPDAELRAQPREAESETVAENGSAEEKFNDFNELTAEPVTARRSGGALPT